MDIGMIRCLGKKQSVSFVSGTTRQRIHDEYACDKADVCFPGKPHAAQRLAFRALTTQLPDPGGNRLKEEIDSL